MKGSEVQVLTEAGGCTDPFTLQYVAGHDSIKTTMRYVHPQANAVQESVSQACGPAWQAIPSAEWAEVQGRCKIRCSCNSTPHGLHGASR